MLNLGLMAVGEGESLLKVLNSLAHHNHYKKDLESWTQKPEKVGSKLSKSIGEDEVMDLVHHNHHKKDLGKRTYRNTEYQEGDLKEETLDLLD